jgi:hypothetical protein
MTDRILECEYHPGEEFVLRFRPPKLQMVSEPTREHLRTARKEMLLAIRSMIDMAIQRIEKAEGASAKNVTKIEVK